MSKRTVRKPEWVVVVPNEEYRALLAVARAARGFHVGMYPATGRCGPGAFGAPLQRALDRLDKVSKPHDGEGAYWTEQHMR